MLLLLAPQLVPVHLSVWPVNTLNHLPIYLSIYVTPNRLHRPGIPGLSRSTNTRKGINPLSLFLFRTEPSKPDSEHIHTRRSLSPPVIDRLDYQYIEAITIIRKVLSTQYTYKRRSRWEIVSPIRPARAQRNHQEKDKSLDQVQVLPTQAQAQIQPSTRPQVRPQDQGKGERITLPPHPQL